MEVLNLVTMSSREMAELTEKRHDSVKRTIETLTESGVIIQPQIVDEQSTDSMGRMRTTQVYNLDKRSSIIVVAQLSPEFTARLVDRWQELENIVAAPVKAALPPMTISEKYEQMLAAKRLVQDEQLKALLPLIWQEVSDGVQNDIVAMFGGQKRIQGPDATPLDIMEIAKREGIVVPANSKSVLGKHVKAQSSVAPVSIERVINGSVRSANAYTNHVEVASIIKKYLSRIYS